MKNWVEAMDRMEGAFRSASCLALLALIPGGNSICTTSPCALGDAGPEATNCRPGGAGGDTLELWKQKGDQSRLANYRVN